MPFFLSVDAVCYIFEEQGKYETWSQKRKRMATRARVSRSQVKARSPGSDAGECRETGRLGGRWASLGGAVRFLVLLVILMLVLMWVLLVTPMFVLCKVS